VLGKVYSIEQLREIAKVYGIEGGAEEETEEEADGEGKRGISQRYEFAKGIAEAQTSQDIGEVWSRTDHDFFFALSGWGRYFATVPSGMHPLGCGGHQHPPSRSCGLLLRPASSVGLGRITSRDWSSYPILRFSSIPDEVRVHVLNQPGAPFLGTGEAAQGPTAAAIANAIADATGTRLRDIPLRLP